jgi:hypothetical protein
MVGEYEHPVSKVTARMDSGPATILARSEHSAHPGRGPLLAELWCVPSLTLRRKATGGGTLSLGPAHEREEASSARAGTG